jgi:Poly(ADP-ribose) polymerase and DNA-Ligase Zn-finger region
MQPASQAVMMEGPSPPRGVQPASAVDPFSDEDGEGPSAAELAAIAEFAAKNGEHGGFQPNGKRYQIQFARSGRSACRACGTTIPLAALRFGSAQEGRLHGTLMWRCLECVTGRQLVNVVDTYGEGWSKIPGWEILGDAADARAVKFDRLHAAVGEWMAEKEQARIEAQHKRNAKAAKTEVRLRWLASDVNSLDWRRLVQDGELNDEPCSTLHYFLLGLGLVSTGTKPILLARLREHAGKENKPVAETDVKDEVTESKAKIKQTIKVEATTEGIDSASAAGNVGDVNTAVKEADDVQRVVKVEKMDEDVQRVVKVEKMDEDVLEDIGETEPEADKSVTRAKVLKATKAISKSKIKAELKSKTKLESKSNTKAISSGSEKKKKKTAKPKAKRVRTFPPESSAILSRSERAARRSNAKA